MTGHVWMVCYYCRMATVIEVNSLIGSLQNPLTPADNQEPGHFWCGCDEGKPYHAPDHARSATAECQWWVKKENGGYRMCLQPARHERRGADGGKRYYYCDDHIAQLDQDRAAIQRVLDHPSVSEGEVAIERHTYPKLTENDGAPFSAQKDKE